MRNVIKSFCFIIILIILLTVSIFLLIPKNNLYKYNFLDYLDYEILEEKDNTVDVLFVGDSLVYSSVSPMEIWNEYGFTSFDCSTPAQLTETSYKYIKIAVERQHPKVIFLEANVLFRDPAKRTTERKMEDFVDKFSIISRYHDNWKDLIEYGTKINVNKGYKYINRVHEAKKFNYMKNLNKKEKIPEVNVEYFDKIIEICEENNIKLILFGVPSMKSWTYAKDQKAKEFANKYNLEFIDLNLVKDLKIDWKYETKDEGSHLNYEGAKKVSHYLGNYIFENNLVESHKDDPFYDTYKIAYDKYVEELKFY